MAHGLCILGRREILYTRLIAFPVKLVSSFSSKRWTLAGAANWSIGERKAHLRRSWRILETCGSTRANPFFKLLRFHCDHFWGHERRYAAYLIACICKYRFTR